jgi:hypothetical protein
MDASLSGGIVKTGMPLFRVWIIFEPEEAQQAAIIRQMHEKQQGQYSFPHGAMDYGRGRKSSKKLTAPSHS